MNTKLNSIFIIFSLIVISAFCIKPNSEELTVEINAQLPRCARIEFIDCSKNSLENTTSPNCNSYKANHTKINKSLSIAKATTSSIGLMETLYFMICYDEKGKGDEWSIYPTEKNIYPENFLHSRYLEMSNENFFIYKPDELFWNEFNSSLKGKVQSKDNLSNFLNRLN
ncbi:hypothetical protein FH581_001740 [Leptospira weilii]|uniref:hypothetical protein n=1 Tax=Leptospira weilii TaxID=28184 RepID=UPI00201B8C1F|nr:hypothetical protein [Leptospira weilii]UPY77609.1 hypothetical protein FH581_001740 [Leptospira weilii]